jgi:hypothetical protein
MLTAPPRIAPMTKARAALGRYYGATQIAVVLLSVAGYELTRYLTDPNWAAAVTNARRIVDLESKLLIGWEVPIQKAFLAVPDLVQALNLFYFLGHFLLTGIFFFWLYHRSQEGFRSFRDGFIAATVLAALIHWWFPTAPPRLAGVGLVDTLRTFSGIDIGSPRSSVLSNPLAAVPSLHAGYALGVGIGLVRYGRSALARSAGVIYPLLVVLTIVVTGNHFILDAVAGMAVLGLGFVIAQSVRAAMERRKSAAIIDCATRGGAVR